MNPSELAAVERRLRLAYERGRWRRALLGFLPMLVLALIVALLGGRYMLAFSAGLPLFAVGVVALWYGRDPGRAVLPAAFGGSLALVFAVCANQMGHFCTGARCLSWCLPACIAGGLLAGGVVSFVGIRQRRGAPYWLAASGITLLTGALGCSCAGYAGVFALLVGFALSVGVSLLAATLRRRAA